MADSHSNRTTKPKPIGIISSCIFVFFKLILLSFTAWIFLLLWFLGKFFLIGEESALISAEHIVFLNNEFIGHPISWLTGWSTFHLFYSPLLSLIVAVTGVVLTRDFIFILALPLFAIFLTIFGTDGLVQRDIRKFQGARESTLIFHRAKLCVSFSFFVPLFIFLSAPVFISPTLFLMTESIMLSISVWFALKYFKKYV